MDNENKLESLTVVLYICDPEKNTECKKSSCKADGKGYCELTRKREAAKHKENGEPMVYSMEGENE